MATRFGIGAAAVVWAAMGGAALAQGAAPLTAADVVGEWTLAITPTERRGMSITVEAAEGGRPDLPLEITAASGDRIACVLRARPAECRVRNGELVVVMPTSSGSARMTFTLTERLAQGFRGSANVRVRLLPFGGHIGAVTMTRR
ncbi:hypothetical protein [Brevundimonas sp.]|uniref:hypothetical protein n=1 Tax=Brevundimonas sp. TaxID=1871086 RepID=UPI0035B1F9D3